MFRFVFSLAVLCFFSFNLLAQNTMSDLDRERNRNMLRTVKDELVKNYFDPKFRGRDIEANYKKAEELLKNAPSNSEAFMVIASFLMELNDSHTRFAPPSRNVKIEHGWSMQMIGDKCFVDAVMPGSDAEKKGLKEGDQILSVEGFATNREDFWQLRYWFYRLNPVSEFNLIVQSPSGAPRKVLVSAKRSTGFPVTDLTNYTEYMNLVRQSENEARINSHRYIEYGDILTIWKMPRFDLDNESVDDIMKKVTKKKALILDLRGNGGGAEVMLLRLIGFFIEQELKIGDLVRRKETKPLIAKPRSDKSYQGKLIILVDSESASSSEVFSRVMQMQKRATIIGDKTKGAVMRSRFYSKQTGVDTVVFYGVSITDADLIMSDGKSLENNGVTPDKLLLPKPLDMAAKRDVALSYAASLAGVEISPEMAGGLFPIIWK